MTDIAADAGRAPPDPRAGPLAGRIGAAPKLADAKGANARLAELLAAADEGGVAALRRRVEGGGSGKTLLAGLADHSGLPVARGDGRPGPSRRAAGR